MKKAYHLVLSKIAIILAVCAFSVSAASAFPFIQISTSEGLSNRHVSSMTIDGNGYYWFATHGGIDRFNGHDFFHYKLKIQSQALKEEQPIGIFKNHLGKIIAYSDQHLYEYTPTTDNFYSFRNLNIPTNSNITIVKTDQYGNLWIGTTKGLYIYNSQHKLIAYTCKQLVIYCISFTEKTEAFVGTSRGIRKISHPQDGNLSEYIPIPFRTISGQRIQSIFCDPQTKMMWIGTFDGTLYVADSHFNGRMTLIKEFNRPIRSIVTIDTDRIWVGVDGQGIFVYNRFTTSQLEEFTRTEDTIHRYIGSNGVYYICEDKDLVWICTFSNGILVYDKSMLVKTVFTGIDMRLSPFADPQVNCVREDRKGRIWFGTNNGIIRFDPQSNTWKHFTGLSQNGGTVLSLLEDRMGNMWVGGFMFNVLYINTTDQIKYPIVSKGTKQFPMHVYSIYEDSNGDIYFGGIINPMAKYNPSRGELSTYPIRGIYQITAWKPGHLLLATAKGLVLFNTYTGKSISLNKLSNNPLLYSSITRLCLNPSNKNELWIGTESNGLAKLNLKTGQITNITTDDGLSSMMICGLEYDRNNRLWVSTEDGLNCISNNGSITALYKADGLPNRTMKTRAHYSLSSGEIIWGTPTGAFVIDPEHFTDSHRTINLHFEKFVLSGNDILPGLEGSPLPTILDNIKELELSNLQNNFSISFCNVGFQQESQSLYSYYLEGFDRTWSKPSSTTTAHYTNIPPGTYIFHIKATDKSDKHNTAERTLIIHIAQPWYNTIWAWICYVILLIGSLYIFFKLYRRWMSVRDSDQKVRFFVNLAHDLRTPLTLIKAPLQEVNTDSLSTDDKSALNLAKKNADKLLTMVNQLLDFQKIEREAMTLKVEKTEIGSFLREEACNFIPLAQSKNITLKIEGCDVTGYIDRKKIIVIVDNLLSNAIKYTETGGNVMIEWKSEGEELSISVIDDGIGIPHDSQKKLFKRFYRADNASNATATGSGIGLLLTKKMAVLHKGTINVTSEEGVGSSFTISLPICRKKYSSHEILDNTSLDKYETLAEESAEQNESHPSLMLIEDNNELRQYLDHYLSKNYNVSSFANGNSALENIKSVMPDFVLTDVMMPGISGLELCTKIKNDIETSHIPVILLTSLAEREDIIKGFNAGADDYITKPFDIFVLNKKIASIIKARKSIKEKIIDKKDIDSNDTTLPICELDKCFLQKAISVIEENLSNEDFSINDLVAEMAMSRSVFFKKIKAITQQNPHEMIRDIKMKKAAELLKENKYNIAEISYMVGFANPKYFSTAFKNFFGVSPSRFLENEI